VVNSEPEGWDRPRRGRERNRSTILYRRAMGGANRDQSKPACDVRLRHLAWAGVEAVADGTRVLIDPLEDVAPLTGFLGAPRRPVPRIKLPAEVKTHALVTHLHPGSYSRRGVPCWCESSSLALCFDFGASSSGFAAARWVCVLDRCRCRRQASGSGAPTWV